MDLLQLPALALTNVVNFLPLLDKLNVTQVCHDLRSLTLGSSRIWKSICILSSSPFGSSWREINTARITARQKDNDQRAMIELEIRKSIDALVSRLLCTIKIGLIENITINIDFGSISVKSVRKLLMTQERLVSLDISLVPPDSYSTHDRRLEEQAKNAEINGIVLNVIAKHQSTLEHVELSNLSMKVAEWVDNLANAEFPSLKSIGYPNFNPHVPITDQIAFDDAMSRCFINLFTQTLKNKGVEKINMKNLATGMQFRRSWGDGVAEAFMSVLEKNVTPNLRHVDLNVIDSCVRYHRETESPVVDALTKFCPNLSHLFHGVTSSTGGSFPPLTKPINVSENHPMLIIVLPRLISHYSTNLLSITCTINDSIAEIISTHCCNLTTLNIACHLKMLRMYPEPEETYPLFTDKGLLDLTKLTKLENFAFHMNGSVTKDAFVKFLQVSIGHLKELSLYLPRDFYSDSQLYDTLDRGTANLKKLCLSHSPLIQPHMLTSDYRVATCLQRIQSKMQNFSSLNYLCIWLANDQERSDSNIVSLIRHLFETIVTFHLQLKCFVFHISGHRVPENELNYIINNLPSCEVFANMYP